MPRRPRSSRAATERVLRRAQAGATQAVVRAREGLVRRLVRYDNQLGRRLNTEAARIRRDLRRTGLRGRPLDRRVSRSMLRVMSRERAALSSTVGAAGRLGRDAARGTGEAFFDAVPRGGVGRLTPRLVGRMERDFETGLSRVRVVPPNLSSTLRRNAEVSSRRMAASLNRSLAAGDSVDQATRGILAADTPIVHIPRYLEDLRTAVRNSDSRLLARAVGRHTSVIRSQVSGGDAFIRRAVRSFGGEVAPTLARDVDRLTNQFVIDRARYQARRIARTEMARAFNDAYVEATEDVPFAQGYRWNLSGSHPKPDVCDMFASADIAGLGAGVYPADQRPPLPAHPHCLCFLTVEMLSVDQLEAVSRGDAPPAPGEGQPFSGWLRDQSTEAQDSILGRGRAARLRAATGQTAFDGIVDPATGELAPLYEIEGREAPTRDLGARVDLTSRVGADPVPQRSRVADS